MNIVGEVENETNGESSINTYTLLGVRWVAYEKGLCSTCGTVWFSVIPGGMGGREGDWRHMACMYNYG